MYTFPEARVPRGLCDHMTEGRMDLSCKTDILRNDRWRCANRASWGSYMRKRESLRTTVKLANYKGERDPLAKVVSVINATCRR